MDPEATPKPSHREAKKQECRRTIARAAVRLFEEKGFEATTMDEIAHAAGVSRPTVFNYFARKEDILDLLAVLMAQQLADLTDELATRNDDPVGLLRRAMIGMAEAFSRFPETSRAFHALKMQEARVRRHDRKLSFEDPANPLRRQHEFIEKLIRQAQEHGQIRDDYTPCELSTHLLIGLFASTMGPWLNGMFGDAPLTDVVDRHFQLFLEGMTR